MPSASDDVRAFVRALAQDPEARAELARLVADHYLREVRDELRALAEAQRRTEERVEALAEAQRRTEERVGRVEEQLAALAEAQRRTEERLEALAETVRRLGETVAGLAHDVAVLKGLSLETHYLLHADGMFGPIARGIRVLDGPALDALLAPAIEAGRLSADEAVDVRRADVLAVGRRDGGEVYLVVEVSWAIDQQDVERARDRAAVLERAGVRTFPVVAGQVIHPAVDEVARASGVWRVLDGSVREPVA
ncbi:MAG TPA: hypothetical protein VNO79_09425 [Actinomycetota bacterium]|nr:hypothetical protein [Actinomycetota bacterium]